MKPCLHDSRPLYDLLIEPLRIVAKANGYAKQSAFFWRQSSWDSDQVARLRAKAGLDPASPVSFNGQ